MRRLARIRFFEIIKCAAASLRLGSWLEAWCDLAGISGGMFPDAKPLISAEQVAFLRKETSRQNAEIASVARRETGVTVEQPPHVTSGSSFGF